MQENKDNRNRQKWSEWFAKELDLMEKLKKPEDKALRWKGLLRAAVVGVPFLFVADFLRLTELIGGAGDGVGRASINLFFVSLPTLTLLWWFRTYDARQQIQKTQENINANLFGMYLNILRAEKKEERISGLLGLVRLKQKGFFAEEIEATTQQNLNLAGVNLKNKDLSSMNLSNADFQGADLVRANLFNVNLSGANLSKANLTGTILRGANLEGANLEGANLASANLEGANLASANIEGTNLEGANLASANLEGANLKDKNLEDANLAGAKLRGAKLKGVILRGANLEGASLKDKNLEGASLEGANLASANLEGANLKGANLVGTNLEGAKLKGAEYSEGTKFSEDFNPEEAGMKRVK